METKMNTELDLELTWLFEERTEDPCEHSGHETQPMWHSGPGEWLIQANPKICGHSTGEPFLVCDGYKARIVDPQQPTRCYTCGEVVYTSYTVLGRKGVDF